MIEAIKDTKLALEVLGIPKKIRDLENKPVPLVSSGLSRSTADSTYVKLDQTTPQTTVGTFTFPEIIDSGLTGSKLVFTTSGKQLTSTGIGTSSQFLKADGSLDSNTYLTTETDPLSWHLTGDQATISGTKSGTYNLSTSGTIGGGVITGTGFAISGATHTAGKFLRADGTNFKASTLILPDSATTTRIVFATGTNTWGEDAGLIYNATTDLLTVTDSLTVSGGTTTLKGLNITGRIINTAITGAASQVGSVVTLVGGTGGNSTDANGGAGGAVSLTSGAGGVSSSGADPCGNGGAATLSAGNGGANTTSGSRSGSGGSITMQAGQAGQYVAGFSPVPGVGGDINLNSGAGGVCQPTGNNPSLYTGSTAGSFKLNGSQGGNTTKLTGTGNIKGGAGASMTVQSGQGGWGSNEAGGNATGGDAGAFSFTGGRGGTVNKITSTGGAVGIAGVGAVITFTSGNGGNCTDCSTSNTGGAAGDINFVAGIGGTGITANGNNGHIIFKSNTTEIARFDNTAGLLGRFGIGIAPTAFLTLKAGTAAAGTAPIKLTTGTSLTAAEAGAVEFTTDDLFFTITTGAARKGVVLNDGTNLTSGRIPAATTNGRLIDGPTPVADGTYTVGARLTPLGTDGTITTSKGIITAITQAT